LASEYRPDLIGKSFKELYDGLPQDLKDGVDRVFWCFKTKLPSMQGLDMKEVLDFDLTADDLRYLYDPLLPSELEDTLTEEEKTLALASIDPVMFVRSFLNYQPRVYQILMMRSPERVKSYRCGRRAGKSTCMTWEAIWFAYVNPGVRIIIVAPLEAQIKLLWDMVDEMVLHSGIKPLKSALAAFGVASKIRKPWELHFNNGSRIKAFTSGARSGGKADSVRGNEAHMIIVDEMDLMMPDDLNAITAMMQKTSDEFSGEKRLIVSSTPNGRRDMFYAFSRKDTVKEFWFPSFVNPYFGPADEKEQRDFLTESGFIHEICFHPDQNISLHDGTIKRISDVNVGDKLYSNIEGNCSISTVINHGKTREESEIIDVKTWIGNIACTPDHKVKTFKDGTIIKESINDADNIIASPSFGAYDMSREKALARIIGFINGDGTVTDRGEYYQASFYSKYYEDLVPIANDFEILFGFRPNISAKHIKGYDGNWQIVCARRDVTNFLVEHGAQIGKKTELVSDVPLWIENSSTEVALEFIGALWGAEGSVRFFDGNWKHLYLSQQKTNAALCGNLFEWMHKILSSVGIDSKYTIKEKKPSFGTTKMGQKFRSRANIEEKLCIKVTNNNAINIFSKLKPRYSIKKEIAFFHAMVLAYRREYEIREVRARASSVLLDRSNGMQIKDICSKFNLSASQVGKILYPDKKNRLTRISGKINLESIEIIEDGSVVIPILSKTTMDSGPVYNITVDSKDHSFLLINGINLYNCAGWGQQTTGVFKPSILEFVAPESYSYWSSRRQCGPIICGVDWDKYGAGVNIVVVANVDGLLTVIHREEIDRAQHEHTLGAGVDRVIELDKIFSFSYVYCDRGYGERQWEELVQKMPYGDIRVMGKNFSSSVLETNPVTGATDKEEFKPFMVDNAVNLYEKRKVRVNPDDEKFIAQIQGYVQLRVSATGRPVFGSMDSERIGDHALDAWMMALLGHTEKYGDLIMPREYIPPRVVSTNDSLAPGDTKEERHTNSRSILMQRRPMSSGSRKASANVFNRPGI